MNLFYIFFICVLYTKGTSSLDLVDITVPSVVLIDGENDTEPITLDCVYQVEDDVKTLVVKWLKDDKPVYQWIYGQEPIVFKDFKDTVSAFMASTDENKLFRAIKVQRNIGASGTYKCMVYTTEDTKSMEKELQVIDIENYSINVQASFDGNKTQVECSITNVFPKPVLELVTDDNDTVIVMDNLAQEDSNGYFNVTLVALVNDDDEDFDEYKCIVKFADSDFVLTTSALSSASLTFSRLHIFCAIFFSSLLSIIFSIPSLSLK